MASAGERAYNGGLCPQRSPGAEPLVRGLQPPEAETIFKAVVKLGFWDEILLGITYH